MGALEIVLLAAGAVIFIASFCIPVKQEKLKEETKNLAAQEVKNLVAEEMENVREHLSELSEEEMRQQIEKSERSMERISNEKIMAVNEYSDTVLDEIHKNHEEVVFLYDMLKGKSVSLSEAYDKADQNIQGLLQQVKDAEITVRENLEGMESAGQRKAPVSRKAEDPGKAAPGRRKAEDPEGALSGRRKAADSQKTPVSGKRAADQQAAEEIRMENMLFTVAGKQEEAAGETAFQPFVPERVEVVPKKKETGKAPKKAEDEADAASRKIKAEGAKEVVEKQLKAAAEEKEEEPWITFENEDVKRLLFDPADVTDPAERDMGNSNERILELHRAGKSNMAIARELGLGVGEVKLVIDLYEGPR